MGKCFECGVNSGNYDFCKNCYKKLSSEDLIEECEECGQWHYVGKPCLCEMPFMQCKLCGRWHYSEDDCICKTSKTNIQSQNYKKKDLLSNPEMIFFNILEKAIDPKEYRINQQVPLRMIVEEKKHSWGQHLHKYIDFGIISRKNNSIVLLIEYDDSTHDMENRQTRDEKVDKICNDAGIRLVHIPRDDNMNVNFLQRFLKQYLK